MGRCPASSMSERPRVALSYPLQQMARRSRASPPASHPPPDFCSGFYGTLPVLPGPMPRGQKRR